MDNSNVKVPVGFDSFGPWFSESIDLLKAQWQTWILISLIYLAIAGAGGAAISMALRPLSGIVGAVVAALLLPGMVQAALKQIRGGKIEVSDMFSRTDLFVGALVIWIAMGVGIIACCIGVFVTAGLFLLALPLLVDKGIPFGDALSQSMNVTKQNLMFFIIYSFVMSLVAVLGAIAFGIGIIVTYPIWIIGMVVAYERTFNAPAAPAAPATEPTPEPPTAP